MVAVADIPSSMRPYGPRGAARELFTTKDSEVLIDGPAGTGKSIALLSKAYLIAEKYAGARILLIRQTRESMTASVLVTWEEKVVPEGHACLSGPKRDTRNAYFFPNGSEVNVGGVKSYGRDATAKIMSTEYDMILVFESTEVSEDDFEKLTTRLRNGRVPYQQIIADCNPSHERHWLKRRADVGKMKRLISRHVDNPTLYGRDGSPTEFGKRYLAKLEGLSGARKARLFEGRWCAAEGVVYEDFDEAVHIIDRFDIPDDWRRIRSIDFGYTNPFVCQWWAIDPDGRIYLYREIYGTRRLVEDWARDINRHSEGERIEATVADHDAEDRATLERHGIASVPAHKAISPGIEGVSARLRNAGDGKPRLYLLRDALVSKDPALDETKKPCCIAEEFDSYVWPRGQDGRPDKEVPVKDNDHGMDGMRYAVAHVDGLGHQEVYIGGDWLDETNSKDDWNEQPDEWR